MLFSVSFSLVFSFSFSLSRSSDKSDKDVNRNSPIVISRLTRRQFTIKPCCRQSKECVQNSTCWSNPFPISGLSNRRHSDFNLTDASRRDEGIWENVGAASLNWRQGLNFWFCRTASTAAALVVANLSPREFCAFVNFLPRFARNPDRLSDPRTNHPVCDPFVRRGAFKSTA